MWARQILLGIIGLSSGMLVASGLFSFITGLGVISDFADRTHTGEHVLLYEDAVAAGGILGNLFFIFQPHIAGAGWLLPVFGLLAGVFTGCWAMELIRCIPWVILGTAIGKCAGSLLFFYQRWGR